MLLVGKKNALGLATYRCRRDMIQWPDLVMS